tara:strand:- start:2279 stop:4018 length:1740 start_codon:yes stop_codon:yes gene_type:complete
MTNYLSRQILYLLLLFSLIFNQECDIINFGNYGDCALPLAYGWNGNNCVLVYGCDLGDDENSFFNTFEECDIQCSNYSALGDVNNDGYINVIDVVAIVNMVLSEDAYIEYSDLNFDGLINVIDVVALVNLIVISENETRHTWQIINEDILTPKCANCHYQGSFFAETSNLILTEDVAYSQLLNRIPDNNSANTDDLVLISNETGMLGLLRSYFWEKININNEVHFYGEHPQYGEIMPLGGPFLKNGELDFIEDWIWAGAPEEGIVADPLILNDQSEYSAPEFTPPDPPILGFQYHIGPFDVMPNTEREFLYYVPSESNDYYVNRVEIAMAPGSHHFIAYKFSDDYNGTLPEIYTYRDIHDPYIYESPLNPEWIENVMALQEHTFIFGTQWPVWDYSFPEGVALKITTDYGLDLNPHYFNYTDETIQGEVYLNLHASLPQDVVHEAGILQLGNNNISLPPNETTTLEKEFSTNGILNGINIEPPNSNSELKIFQLFSHAHQLMTRFDILIRHENGQEELIYTALDYEHPPILELDPPLTLQQGQSIISRATYNNTTNDYINFGLLSTDEMMIIFGLVYFE